MSHDEIPSAKPAQPQHEWVVKLVGFVGCVLFPAFVTGIAPLCVTHFERANGQVQAHVSTNFLFLIPYRQQQLDDVKTVNTRFVAGEISRYPNSHSHNSHKEVRSEDQAFLNILGEKDFIQVPVSPASIQQIKASAETFLSSNDQTHLRLVTVANWKVAIAGGFLSLLTILYVIGVTLSFGRFIVRLAFPRQTI